MIDRGQARFNRQSLSRCATDVIHSLKTFAMTQTRLQHSAPADSTRSTNEGSERRLYEQVADELALDIQQGVYPSGQKVPSVRKLSRARGVSISTVSQAYSLLEDRGLIHAKPQSGYFVRFGLEQPSAAPPVSIGEAPSQVTKGGLITQMLADSQRCTGIDFGVAIPDISLLPHRALQNHLQKAARFQLSEVINYQFSPGYEPLRAQIAMRMRAIGVRCHPDEVVITNGCTEALSLCLRANSQRGDTIAVESPCYYGFLQMAEVMGLKVIEIPTDPNTGMSIEALQLALQQWSIKLVVLGARFSNPTGASLSGDKQQQLVQLLSQYDLKAIEDDIYGELGFDSQQQTVLKSFDSEGRVLYCSSFSKTVAPGLRVGWCLPGRSLESLKNLQTFSALANSSLPQCALASYLQHGHYDKHLRNLRRVAQQNLGYCSAAIREHFPADTLLSQPRGGFVLWVCLPKGVQAVALQQLASREGINLMPGDVFSNTDHFAGNIRLNCALPWGEPVKQALARLGQLVHQLQSQ